MLINFLKKLKNWVDPNYWGQVLGDKTGAFKKAENSKVQGIIQSKQAAKLSSDQTLKTYRIAVSATGEFTQFWGDDDDTNGTNKEDAYAKIISTINRINQVFQIDLGVQLQLVLGV